MASAWENVKEHSSKAGQSLKEDWEDMLEDEEEHGEKTERQAEKSNKAYTAGQDLSEEAKNKLIIQEAELNDNLECALDLLGEPLKRPAAASTRAAAPTTISISACKKAPSYSIDQANPRTKEDFEAFSGALFAKIMLFQTAPNHALFVEGLIRKLAEASLDTAQTRKLVSEMQTLLNTKLQKKDASAAAKLKQHGQVKPSLKFGGSLKTSFDHDYQSYAEEFLEDDF